MHYYFFIGISTVDIKIFLGQWFEQEIEIMKYEIREMFPVVCIDYSVGSDRQFVATIECFDWKDIFFREKFKNSLLALWTNWFVNLR